MLQNRRHAQACAAWLSKCIDVRMNDPIRYQLPDSTNNSVRQMLIALAVFFITLIIFVALVFYNAQFIAKKIPFSAEQRFVRPYEDLLARFFGDEDDQPAVTAYLQSLSDKLQSSMQIAADIEVKIHYIDADLLNAFATLGGHIFITRGLLDELPDENSLAMVLAHEIAHVAHRDPVAGISRGLALQLVFGFLTGGGGSAQDVADLLGGSGLAMFSREQERQADIVALHALNNHYGHVSGYRSFFETVRKAELDEQQEQGSEEDFAQDLETSWLASHPDTAERLEYLDQEREKINARLGEVLAFPTELLLDGETE